MFYEEGGETLEQVAQRGCRGPMPGNIQGQVGRGSEQPALVEDVPAHCRVDGILCLADILTDNTHSEATHAEAAAVIAQITSPHLTFTQHLSSFLENMEEIVTALVKLCQEASSGEVFLLASAALANITFFDTMACEILLQLNAMKILLAACSDKHIVDTPYSRDQGWRLNHFPGQPVPMLDNPFGEVKFPNIQSKPPLAQLEATSSRPITCYLGEETDPHLSTTSFQAVVESDKVSPQPPFLQAKQPQFPQPLLIRLVLQTLHQLCCPSLDTLQHLNVSLVVRDPKLNTVFEAEQPQLSQPVLLGEVLQPSDRFCGAPLDPLHQVHVLLVLRAPELEAALQAALRRLAIMSPDGLEDSDFQQLDVSQRLCVPFYLESRHSSVNGQKKI
ncbi:hypothetical protein QYF61_015189 [Mycteria americana]|uniref:Protein inscuteable homologue C-terminal domain-containing protein n=1 Tax=Mycteria americana TaxID=33587 RepID=A0AAN7NU20_MYCAM|nr:hypothetical protein QYF61_015189 [Mycteria americana]